MWLMTLPSDTILISVTVQSLASDYITVSGIIIAITSSTVFEDDVSSGDVVKVKAFSADDGLLITHEIELWFAPTMTMMIRSS